MWLTTSATWVASRISLLIRCERSPNPVSVGVNTLWPCRSSRSVTRRQHQPPCQAPCTRTKVFAADEAMNVPSQKADSGGGGQSVDKWEKPVFPAVIFGRLHPSRIATHL